VLGLDKLELRTYIAEPDRGPQNWLGKAAEKAAVYGNRRRIQGNRGKGLQRRRGERIARNFAHRFDTADRAGWSRSIPVERLVGPFGLTVRNGPG